MPENPFDPNAMVGVADAARILGIREDSVRALTNSGTLPSVREHSDRTGYEHRKFRVADLAVYRETRATRLRIQIAKLKRAEAIA